MQLSWCYSKILLPNPTITSKSPGKAREAEHSEMKGSTQRSEGAFIGHGSTNRAGGHPKIRRGSTLRAEGALQVGGALREQRGTLRLGKGVLRDQGWSTHRAGSTTKSGEGAL